MDRERLAWLRVGAALGDASALALLWIGVVALRAGVEFGPLLAIDPGLHRPLGLLLVPLWIACLRSVGSYRGLRTKPPRVVAGEVMRAAVLGTIAAAAALFALDLDWVSRSTLGAWAVASVPTVVGFRELQGVFLRSLRRRRFDPHRVLLVGVAAAEPTVDAWFARPEWGIDKVGVIDRDPAALAAILTRETVDEVFLIGPIGADVSALARVCEDFGVPLSFDANFLGVLGRPELGEFEGRPLLTFARIPRGETGMLVKRALDLAIGGGLLVLGAPVGVLIGAAVWASSGRPIFFGQARVGRFGRTFTMWKFRTMVVDAESRLAGLSQLNEVDGPAFKLRADPRVTKIGSLLRRTSLDELPQLWNVVCGHMSLVGPRPPLRTEVERYERWQLRRLSMKPGLTGLWQVSGRSDLPFERWMALDLEYIDRWSLWLDLEVLARTVPAVVRGTGAR